MDLSRNSYISAAEYTLLQYGRVYSHLIYLNLRSRCRANLHWRNGWPTPVIFPVGNLQLSSFWTPAPPMSQQESLLSSEFVENSWIEPALVLPSYEEFSSGVRPTLDGDTSISSLNDSHDMLSASFEAIDLTVARETKRTDPKLCCRFCGNEMTSKRNLNKHHEIHERERHMKNLDRFFQDNTNEENARTYYPKRLKNLRPRTMARKNPY